MKPTAIAHATHVFAKPLDWDEAKDGECVPLTARQLDNCIQSAWKPSPEELAILNAGGVVILSVFGSSQPPVAIDAEPDIEAERLDQLSTAAAEAFGIGTP